MKESHFLALDHVRFHHTPFYIWKLCVLCTLDPYVKVWLMNKDKRVEKKKTVVMKRCLNPVFNESFPFDVPAHVLRETTIVITVMDKDRLSRNDVIGKVRWYGRAFSAALNIFIC